MGCWWLLALAFAADPAAVRADLERWDRALASHGKYTFAWTDEEIQTLADGNIVRRRQQLEGADRVLGAAWAPVGLAELWTAVQDEWHWGHVQGLIEEQLPGCTFEDRLLYQRLDLPWPFKDRQWVIRVVSNGALWEATNRQAIERTWELDPTRGARAEAPDGLWVDVNDGGWFAAPVAGGSVVVYHVRAVVGGNVPEETASTWTLMTLGGLMKGLVAASAESRGHYVGDHPRVRWPDGQEVPAFR